MNQYNEYRLTLLPMFFFFPLPNLYHFFIDFILLLRLCSFFARLSKGYIELFSIFFFYMCIDTNNLSIIS